MKPFAYLSTIILSVTVFVVVVGAAKVSLDDLVHSTNAGQQPSAIERPARVKRHSAAYSPRVFFPGYYYGQPWLHPQYVPATIDDDGPLTSVRRLRRGTTSNPSHRQRQRYSVWDLSRRRRRRSTASLAETSHRRQKRQLDFYDGGNALSSGYSLSDLRLRHPQQSPGIEPSYYHSNNAYTAWDLSRRRRRRRQVLNGFDATGGGLGANEDSNAQSPDGGRRHTLGADRLPQYTIWDLVRRRRAAAIQGR